MHIIESYAAIELPANNCIPTQENTRFLTEDIFAVTVLDPPYHSAIRYTRQPTWEVYLPVGQVGPANEANIRPFRKELVDYGEPITIHFLVVIHHTDEFPVGFANTAIKSGSPPLESFQYVPQPPAKLSL